MGEAKDKEARLAEALRANLRRRKAQARAAAQGEPAPDAPPAAGPGADRGDPG